ncbi:MarR family transcriptional regulator [Natrarchaeobaculum sulfurireducens]|uniref:MarR family transcriptional regulator n=1 Tax=Natrarchaeobaculum sulfurireducens TaxID=2044521 RepID=UPI000E3C36F3|nr:MarR family transcriptional regulator [Natrarchaeobaculum sulfurireducens]
MRYSGDWMSLVDDRILEYICENDSGSPKKMKDEGRIRYSRQHIARRCRKLAEKGLLTHLGNGVYIITDEGEAYLKGELDTETWTRVEQNGNSSATGNASNST